MNEIIKKLTQNLVKNEPLSSEEFKNLSSSIKYPFPSDYLEYMQIWNGGEGTINEAYLVLWRLEELEECNKLYMVDEFAPGLFFIGSDGGGTAYAIRKINGEIVEVPFIGMSDEEASNCGNNFVDFLLFLYRKNK